MQQPVVDDIISLFFNIGRKLRQQLGVNCSVFALTVQQLETLRYTSEHNKPAMKELSDFLSITPPSTTILVDHLAREKLISRQRDSKNRRIIYLVLTKKGDILLQKALKLRDEQMKILLKNLNRQEQVGMLRLLKKMSLSN